MRGAAARFPWPARSSITRTCIEGETTAASGVATFISCAGARVTRRGGRAGGADANASAANLAKRMLASAMREHNESVMRELGDEYTERRDEASGLAGTRRRLEQEREEAVAREAEEAAKEAARRRRRETTTKQRIEAKLKALRKKRR